MHAKAHNAQLLAVQVAGTLLIDGTVLTSQGHLRAACSGHRGAALQPGAPDPEM